MKKALITVNILTLLLIWFQACKPSGIVEKTVSYYNCDKDETQGHKIEEFIDVVSRYKSNYADVINYRIKGLPYEASKPNDGNQLVGQDFEDSRVVRYPIDSLKKFICTIEKYSNQLGIEHEKLGINFYFATYGALTDINRKDHSYHHTLFLVPSLKENGSLIDFDPRYTVKQKRGKNNLVTFAELINSPTPIDNALFRGSEDEIDINPLDPNKMNGCPPRCGAGGNRTMQAIDSKFPSGKPYRYSSLGN